MSASLQVATGPVPALWELEVQVAEVIATLTGISCDAIRPNSRLLEDLGIDSLEFVELIMALEERFLVEVPDDLSTKMFVREPLTVSVMAEVVRHQWGTGQPERERWVGKSPAQITPAIVPLTQFGGEVARDSKCNNGLYEAMSPTQSGHLQWRRRTDGMRCIQIPPGEVEIGSALPEAADDERPLHRVKLAGFLMDAEPVSVGAFARFLNSTAGSDPEMPAIWCGVPPEDRRGRHFQLKRSWNCWKPVRGTEQQPMVLVSWFGAAAYSLWANDGDWKAFQSRSFLPSEAQWEYAARGLVSVRYPWGNDQAGNGLALFDLHRARQSYPNMLPLAPVHAKLGMSPFDLHHMAGNVWNWCADWYEPAFYKDPQSCGPDPVQTQPTGVRTERGGSWVGPSCLGRSSFRRGRPPQAVGRCLGFRCTGDVATALCHSEAT